MRCRRQLLLLLLAPAASLAAVCFEEWQCLYHYLDSSRSSEWSFDLRPLCSGDDRVMQVTTPEGYKWTVRYAVCGNTSWACNPSWAHAAAHGSVIQDLQTLPTPGAMTTDPDTGASVPATADCEVLGHTRPEFDLLDETNPSTGGIVLRHSSLPPASHDKYTCPTDARTGYPKERQVRMVLLCDPTLAPTQVVEVSFLEDKPPHGLGTCIYNLTLRAAAACGAPGDPFGPATDPAAAAAAAGFVSPDVAARGVPGTNFGYVLLGAALLLFGQFGWGKLRESGVVDRLPGVSASWERRGAFAKMSTSGGSSGVGAGGGGGGNAAAAAAAPLRYGAA